MSSGSVLQVILSLLLVLAAVVLVGWILKRINLPQQGAGNALKVISGVAVGQRERIVLVEVNDTWLVVGVAPGQVNALHTMPKGSLSAAPGNPRRRRQQVPGLAEADDGETQCPLKGL